MDSGAKMAGEEPEMGKDLGDHRGVFNGGDNLQGAAAMGTMFNFDIEHPFEQPSFGLSV